MTGRKPQNRPSRLTAVLAALVLAASLGACATYSGARYGGPDAPLQARLASAHDGRSPLNFAVSDRAHVAVFRIHDTGFVRALYPYHPGSTSVFRPGAHTVVTSTPSHYRRGWSPLTRFGARSGYAPFYTSSYASSSRCFGRVRTSYLMIVASRQPLAMTRIRDDVPFRYRRLSALSTPFFRGTAFGTMDRLLQRLIPRGVPREDWDVDWIVTSNISAPCGQFLRPPLLRRIAADTDRPPAADSASGDTRRRRLDTGGLPLTPPRIPVDLPEVTVDGSGEPGTRVRVPLPPVAVTPVQPAVPEGRREGPAVEEFDGPGEDGPERRTRVAGPASRDGPSDHFGRLFDADDGRDAEGWIPGWSEDRGRADDRRVIEWSRDLEQWANNPDRHEFPEPPRPPTRRWRGNGNVDWPSSPTPGGRIGDHDHVRDFGDVQRIDPPDRSRRGRDIEVRRPTSSDRGGASDARKSGGGSDDDRGGL